MYPKSAAAKLPISTPLKAMIMSITVSVAISIYAPELIKSKDFLQYLPRVSPKYF